jgi:cytosine/uracil/thiamine/allantoin permease
MNEREFLSIIFSVKRELVSDANIYHRQYIQVLIIPVAFTLAGFIGIAVTSAGISLYGEVLWDPLR